VPPNRRIEFRMGINVGDIIRDGRDIYGDGSTSLVDSKEFAADSPLEERRFEPSVPLLRTAPGLLPRS